MFLQDTIQAEISPACAGTKWAKPSARLHLSGRVSKQQVEGFFPLVLAALKSQEQIIIDAREVAGIDLEAISVLCGIHRHVANQGKALRIEGMKPDLLKEAKDTVTAVRGFGREFEGKGEMWEKIDKIQSARESMIQMNTSLLEKLNKLTGDPIPSRW